jgi:hypothetical protein
MVEITAGYVSGIIAAGVFLGEFAFLAVFLSRLTVQCGFSFQRLSAGLW